MKANKAILFLALSIIIVLCKNTLFERYTIRQTSAISDLVLLPPAIGEIAVLEFKGVFSDYLFLNTLTYMGEKAIKKQALSSDDLQKVYTALNFITDLDPWANDPYVLAETTLPWEGNMVQEANNLMLKAIQANPDDYKFYLFLWFNHFHFLNDPDTAGTYLEKASSIPNAPPYYATLAARMKLYAGKHGQAILFLDALIKETVDPNRRAHLLQRQETLKRMYFLEQKVQEYNKKMGGLPEKLDDLIEEGLLTQIPSDPYGGEFYLLENGRVNTTSNLVQVKKKATESK